MTTMTPTASKLVWGQMTGEAFPDLFFLSTVAILSTLTLGASASSRRGFDNGERGRQNVICRLFLMRTHGC